MPFPMLPLPAPGEVLLVNTHYEDGIAVWNEVLQTLDECGDRDGDAVVLGEDVPESEPRLESGREVVTLRLTENPGWDDLHAGNFPALCPPGFDAPVILQADVAAVFGGVPPLLVDLREIPGRGVRVPVERLAGVLTGLQDGTVTFDDLIRGMDRCGTYLGDAGAPTNPTPTGVIRTGYPQLPPCPEATLVVRTDFENEEGWTDFLAALGPLDQEGYRQVGPGNPGNPDDPDDIGTSELEFHARVVNDPAYEALQPGQVPALIPAVPKGAADTTMVALADARTLEDPAHRLLVVDLYDTPGQSLRIPLSGANAMAANLWTANMDFFEFEDYEEWAD